MEERLGDSDDTAICFEWAVDTAAGATAAETASRGCWASISEDEKRNCGVNRTLISKSLFAVVE